MERVVFDSNVIVAGAGWRGEGFACLIAVARRWVRAYASEYILAEARHHLTLLENSKRFKGHDPWPIFDWFSRAVRLVDPMDLGKRRSRDPKDDPVLGTAVAARAKLVTYDRDLLALKKPFGVEIWSPGEFLVKVHRIP